MKKIYIKPTVRVKRIVADTVLLAASGEVQASDIHFSNEPVDPSSSLSKGYSVWDDNEEE